MAGRAEWEVQIDSNVKQLLGDAEQLRSELNDLKNKKYKIDLDIDSKKLENVITKLDKMLDNLGKGTNDFNQFKELGKYLNDISSGLTNFKTLNSTFSNIESHLSSLKSTISDVGDGQEFSPLLKMINDVKQSIVSLEKASSKMKLDFKFDLGSNEKDERQIQKVAEIRARQLEAYRSLFNKMKFSGFATTSALNFYEPEGSTIEQLISLYKQNIKEMNKNRPNKKKNNDILDSEKEVKNANNQFNNVTRKIKTDSENPIESLFGKTDLTPVIEQLKSIESAIKDIFKAATGLKDALSKGLNVNTSVEEIEKLTNRVKELEQELNKIKTNSHNVDMSSDTSNIHTQNVSKQNLSGKDAIKSTINSAKELDNVLEKIDIPTESFDDILSKLDLAESKLSDIVKITKQAHADGEGKFYNSYTLTDKYGSSEIYGESSQTDKGQLLKYSYIEFDAKQEKKNAELSKKQAAQAIKQIVDADNKLRELEAVKSDMLELNSDASTENIDKLIAKQKDYIDTLEETNKNIINQNDLIDARKKSKEDYDLNKNAKQEKKNAELSKKQAERANKELDKTQKILNDFDKRKNISNDLSLGFENVKDDISKLNKELTDGAISIDKYKEKLSSITSDYSKNLKNQENEIKKELNSAQKFFESNDKNYKAINNRKPESSDRNPKYAENLEKYQMAIANLDAKLKALSKKDIITSDDIQNVKDLKKNIDTCRASLEKMSSSEKGTSALSAAKEIDTMTKYLNKFTGISKEARQSIEALIKSLEFDRSAQNIARVHTEFLKLTKMERLAGREVSGLKSIISEKFRYGLGADIAGMFGFYDVINTLKQGFQEIRELDSALVDMRKVSNETVQSLKEFQSESFSIGDTVGTTGVQIQNSTADWMRLGESLDEASKSAKASNILLNVSEFENIDDATSSLISMSQAYKDLSKMEIVDVANKLGKYIAQTYSNVWCLHFV